MKNKNLSFLRTTWIRFTVLICALQVYTADGLHAQTIPSLFVVVDYMSVEPENLSDYLNLEQEVWKPMHEERIREGMIVGWYLYAVEFSGSSNNYNFAVVSLYDNTEHLENPWNASIPQKIHPKLSVNDILQKTNRLRETAKSELYFSIATAPEIPLEKPASYLQVNYMKVSPEQEAEYESLESEIWQPIHEESIKSGNTSGWGLWKCLFPGGAGREYQYITLDAFSQFSNIFGHDFSIPFQNIHPNKSYADVADKTQESRTIVRSELWDLIDFAIR